MFFKKKDQEDELENGKSHKPLVSTGSQAKTVATPGQSATPSPAQSSHTVASMSQPPASPSPSSNPENSTDIVADRFGKIRSALGPGTVIQGKLSFDTPVSIDGKLSGEVYSSKALIVGKHGVVEAKLLEVATLVVLGTVRGTIRATEGLELLKGGRIEGDVVAPRILVEDGSFFDGTCKMTKEVATTNPIKAESKPSQNKPNAKADAPSSKPEKSAENLSANGSPNAGATI